jgi:hypothetical protein
VLLKGEPPPGSDAAVGVYDVAGPEFRPPVYEEGPPNGGASLGTPLFGFGGMGGAAFLEG